MMVGGASISSYVPESGIQERQHSPDFSLQQIWKLRYSSNGSILYAAGDGGVIRRYRRYPNFHKCLGELFRHRGDVQDMDISPYDECMTSVFLIVLNQHLFPSFGHRFQRQNCWSHMFGLVVPIACLWANQTIINDMLVNRCSQSRVDPILRTVVTLTSLITSIIQRISLLHPFIRSVIRSQTSYHLSNTSRQNSLIITYLLHN